MKTNEGKKYPLQNTAVTLTRAFTVAGFLLCSHDVWAQGTPSPALTIAPLGTNEYSVTITSNIGMTDYDLLWTPFLDNQNYPWSFAAVGVPGGTNFLLDGEGYESAFFRAVLDTNVVPLWEESNPSVPNSPILTVTILSPANGANLNQ